MNNVLIIAAREFRQIAGMRSFWLTLLILPFALAIGPLTQRFMKGDEVQRIMVIDRTIGGGEARAIERQLMIDQNRAALTKLSRFVQRHKLERADPSAPWAQHDRWYSDAEVESFVAAGGARAASARLKAVAEPDTPEFSVPEPLYQMVPVPAQISAAPAAGLDRALRAILDSKTSDDSARKVDFALLVPADFGASPKVRLWANNQPPAALIAAIQGVLTRDLRTRFLGAQGVSPAAARTAGEITPALAISTPPPGSGAREAMLVRSILPLAAAYLLMMSLMLSGSWMLQGTVEERSNKLLESVLACVSPEDLMYGKLLGTVGVGLFMIAVWMAGAGIAAYATQGAIADLIRPALAPLSSPATALAMIYFFVVGYVTISVIFLAIGAMSDSMREAQGYLMPILLAIILPISLLIQSVLTGGGGIGIEILTWVPIWTPFAVLARLGSGIPLWEVVGAGILLAAFTALELVMLGRLFRASLLATGQRPNLAEVIARMRVARG